MFLFNFENFFSQVEYIRGEAILQSQQCWKTRRHHRLSVSNNCAEAEARCHVLRKNQHLGGELKSLKV